jgi:hypothetical protein
MDTLQGWFKELYASQEINLVPDASYITKNISFNKSEAGLGNLYHQPVVLTQEQGFTYAGPSSGAFALNTPVAAVLKDAQVQGAQILLRSQIDYESLARAANSKGSFGEASKLLVKNMVDAISKRLELMFLYGRSATGVGQLTGTHTTTTIQLSTASWSPGLWAGMEGAVIHVLSVTGSLPSLTVGTTRSPTVGVKVSAVDFSTRTITVATNGGGVLTAPANNDIVVFYGSWSSATGGDALTSGAITFKEALGLDSMISQQASTLFNIDLATYGLFKGNVQTGLTALTVTKILNALLPAIGKGLMDDVVWLTSNASFQGLVNPTIDPVAQAGNSNVKTGPMVTQSKSDSLRFGANQIEIVGYQGKITIVPHLFLKDGDNFAFAKKDLMRVGATDVTFNTPGAKGGEFFLHMPSNAGYELRCYANQGLFSPKVGRMTKATL